MNVIDIITGAQADQADASTKTAAAVQASTDAQAATEKASASTAKEAAVLHQTGEVYVRGSDGTITTYDSPDSVNIATRSPKDAASLPVPDDNPAVVPPPPPAGPA